MQTRISGRGAVIFEPRAVVSIKIRVPCFQAATTARAGVRTPLLVRPS